MPTVVQDLISSKKFIFVLVATLLLLIATHFGVISKEDAATFLKILWPTYIGAQGLADFGKSASKVQKTFTLTSPSPVKNTPPEEKKEN